MTASTTRIVIRHLSGSKINQIEQFDLDGLQEISIGREPGSRIAYDLQRDDEVSRKHAVIRVRNDKELYFRIADLNSSNGTFLNGERIVGEVELLPDDVVELGTGGPKFTFDVQPRPANLPSRTRQMSAADSAQTRIVTAKVGATVEHAAADTRQRVVASDTSTVSKIPIGKATIQRMLFDERRKTSRLWIGMSAAIVVLALAGGTGLLLYNRSMSREFERELADAQARAEAIRQETNATISKELGISPEAIKTLGDATVFVQDKWALFDQETRKPLFQRWVKINDEWLPAFVRMSDNNVVRWLTVEDKGGYTPIGEESTGSGFVIDDRGFILTNKHMAAAWKTRYEGDRKVGSAWKGVIYNINERASRRDIYDDVRSQDGDLTSWIPETDSYVFEPSRPVRLSSGKRSVYATNELLTVQFPGTRMEINASLLRTSLDADVAVIKIDAPDRLSKLELVPKDYKVQVGQKIIVMGYPSASLNTIASQQTSEGGRFARRNVLIPEPTVTQGGISKLSPQKRDKGQGDITTLGTVGDTYQLDVFAGSGNSGGPVLNMDGKVLGILTYGSTLAEHISFAVPVSYVRELLQLQRDASP